MPADFARMAPLASSTTVNGDHDLCVLPRSREVFI